MMIGSVAVIVLMIASYGRFGIYATAALVFNVLMIFGIMAGLNTTLSLPGLAGLVLTIGAAVDANVLINERIRSEEHTSELQSLMRISYAVFCLKKKKTNIMRY